MGIFLNRRAFVVAAILAVSCITLFQNCSGYENQTSEPSEDLGNDNFDDKVAGTWKRPCQFSASTNSYYEQTVAFAGGGASEMTTTARYYTNAGCQNLIITEEQKREIVSVTEDEEDYQISAQLISQTVALHTSSIVAYHNSIATCGITNWTQGTPRDTMATSCRRPDVVTDVINVSGGFLFRAVDEVLSPNSGGATTLNATGYVPVN